MSFIGGSVRYIRNLAWYWQVMGGVVVLAAVVAGVHAMTGTEAGVPALSQTPHVKIASVASLSAQTTGPLPVTGQVTSLNRAVILAQSSGEVVVLSRKIGDYVSAGTVIAQLENSSQRASVLQAQGAYDAAQANFQNTSGTGAANSGINATQANQNVANAKNAVDTSLQSMYATLDDAVHTKADLLFSDPRTNAHLILTVPDNQLVITLQNQRTQLELTLEHAGVVASLSSRADVDGDIAAMNADAKLVSAFLNNLVLALNKALPSSEVSASQISAFQSSIGASRSSVVSGLSALSSAKSAYDSAASSAASASNTAGSGTSNSISIAQANVVQAQGVLNAAQAALEKTIIRSPISGTIVSLALTRGGYVSQQAQVIEISNPSALEVETHVTPSDAKTLAVGGTAQISDSTQGVITSIAPALDPTTGKILVKIGIVSGGALTDGDTVSVLLSRATSAQTQKASATLKRILIPIVAAKITPQGPVVFSVTASSSLQAFPVTLGTILGDQITIMGGITVDDVIVTDARGLSPGQTVVVD